MKVLLTGASGFLGNVILQSLVDFNHVITLSRTKADVVVDLSLEAISLPSVDLVVHCAGRAHIVPKTAKEIQSFYDTNLTGTINLIEGLNNAKALPKSFIFISTVAVYGCDSGALISEQHSLNAKDPYGNSKVEAEKILVRWAQNNNIICTILRLPLVVGVNAPGNLASMINGIKRSYYFDIAGGNARRSMVLAEDVAKIIPVVAEIGGIYNLTDRQHPSFSEISNCIAKQLDKPRPLNIPKWIATLMAKIGDIIGQKAPINSNKLKKITYDLTFNDQKAVDAFGWNPTPVLKGFKIK